MLCRTIGMNMASALFPFTYGWFPKRALSTKCQTSSFDSLIPSEKRNRRSLARVIGAALRIMINFPSDVADCSFVRTAFCTERS